MKALKIVLIILVSAFGLLGVLNATANIKMALDPVKADTVFVHRIDTVYITVVPARLRVW